MVARIDTALMTVEEYRALAQANPEVKYEYADGRVYAMSGGTLDHSAIGGNIVGALSDLLDGSPCRVFNSDAKALLSATRWVFPDATVTCDDRDRGSADEIGAPRLIFEVLSETTEAHDRGRKFRWYRACASIEEYVLVATDRRQIEVFRRHPDADIWEFEAYGPGQMLELRSLGLTLPVARLYRGTLVPSGEEGA
jgi:Uma2 family endonuclease